ncbi:hypothetical protein ACTXG7_10025 [Mycolicibacterium sp. Dal123E01]|uniref:hypothetical protein n=1 Tax=Mycolicibacterium sp. Dal123E01 TaxID=3457578 RepID=UPI00403ED634
MKMPSEFSADVQTIVGPLLAQLGFALDEIDDGPDEGGRQQHIVYYRSSDCKIQIYDSWREGEVNCMIAPRNAPNAFGLRTEKWHVLTRFAELPDVSLTDVVDLVKAELDAYPNQLEWVKARIAKYYDEAHAGILAMYDEGR